MEPAGPPPGVLCPAEPEPETEIADAEEDIPLLRQLESLEMDGLDGEFSAINSQVRHRLQPTTLQNTDVRRASR